MTESTQATLVREEWAFEYGGPFGWDVVTVDTDRYVVVDISDVLAEHIVTLHNNWLREMKDIGAVL